ncbi:MAG: complex I NDUFA9 subunit family protein [Arenimonas sp.]
MTELKIVVLGGTGFVGRALVRRLSAHGHQMKVLSRNLATHPDRLLPPDVQVRQLDVYDPEALREEFLGADAVINLVGILNEAGDSGRGFEHAHVDLTRGVVAACHAAGVRRLLQMSSLNAGRGSSHYLKSRGAAEAVVKQSGLHWTVFEPSVIFGVGDGLFERFAIFLKRVPIIPLACAQTRFAPVYIGDVVQAFCNALEDDKTIGEVYELYGPDVYSLRQIVQMSARQLGRKRLVLPLPNVLGRLHAFVCDFVPGKPFSSDNFRSLQTDSVGGIDGLHRLGIVATPVAQVLPDILGHGDDKQARLSRYRAMR